MIDVNQLKQLMDLYRSSVKDPNTYSSNTGFNPTRFDYGGQALDWATKQLQSGGNAPNFFSDLPSNGLAAYVQPKTFTEQRPQQPAYDDPMRGQTMNYLATLMRGR